MKTIIEKKSAEIAATNALLVAAREGRLQRSDLITYLHNLMHLFANTTTNLTHARARAESLGLTQLAAFFSEKTGEEAGHDQWARDDLNRHRAPATEVDASKITPGLHALLAYLKRIIHEDPTLFLSYMVFVEYFTVIVAPEFLNHLEERCGIPRSTMTSIAKHEELDQDHVRDDFRIIGELVTDASTWNRLLQVLDESATRVNRFLAECVSPAEECLAP